LGSTSAFNAFIATGLILQQITYAIPAALLMVKRCQRGAVSEAIPRNRPFRLPSIVGWVINGATVVFAVIVVIFYNFPAVTPVTGLNMSKSATRCLSSAGLTYLWQIIRR
jgi:choline transport protein